MRSGAVHDTITGAVPNTDYGWGRLNAAQSLGVTPSGQAPVIALSASPASPSAGQATTLEVEVQDPGGPPNELEAKWDDGYDGTWETPYGPVAPRTVTYDEAGQYPIKVRVRNGQGRLGEAVVWVNVKEGTVDPNDAGPEASVDATADVAIDAKEDAPSMDAMADAHLDGGVDATMDSHLPEEVVGSGGGGGCGCRTAGGSSQRTAGGLLLTVLVGLSMRRRARGYFC
jgi:MYXO-CTERM domain-containing protein